MLPEKKDDRTYTYADYLSWDESDRIEIIDGKIVMMAPPTTQHQLISGEIFAQLHSYLKGKSCKVVSAPFAVRLFEGSADEPHTVKNIVEPDISVVCDLSKLDQQGYKGAPDMVVEVLSPSTAKYDCLLKLNKYQKAGVKEYWIVDPEEQSVRVYLLDGEFYKTPGVYSPPDQIKVSIFENCVIDLTEIFAE